MTPDQQLCLQALQRAVDDAGEMVTTNQYGHVRAVKATTYITYVRQFMPTKEPKRQTETATRCLGWLQVNRYAVAWGEFVWAV